MAKTPTLQDHKELLPITIETEDITKSIMEYCKANGVDAERVDFKIRAVYTIVFDKINQTTMIFDTTRGQKPSMAHLQNENIKIYQKFIITISEREEQPVKLELALSADKLFTKVIATIKKESKLIYYPGLDRYIYDEINKKLAKHKILVGIFEGNFKTELDRFVKKIRDGEVLSEDYKITVAESKDFIPSEDDKMIFYFKEKHKIDKENPDFYDRGFVVDVDEGEIIAEYKKPKEGKSGRDVRGVYIKVPSPKIQNEPKFSVTPNIRVEETPSVKRYIAAKKGCVAFDGNSMDIQEEIKVKEVSFRHTGSIIVDQDKEITLDIEESNPLVDAIGSNMTVRANEVIVRGSMGDNSRVYADKAQIKGLTHSTSKVFAKEAEIATHRGYLEAKEAKIERLEGGEVVADIVHIGHANSGRIRAKKVYITNLGSNCNITASALIDITDVIGSDNKLFFEVAVTPTEKEMFTKLIQKKEELTKLHADKLAEFKKRVKAVEENKESALKVKQMIDEDLKRGFPPKEAFVLKYKQFTQMLSLAKKSKEEYDELKSSLDNINHEIATFEGRLLDARVINHGIWRNFQTIVFKVQAGRLVYKFIPPENAKMREIGIKKISDTEYVVGEIV